MKKNNKGAARAKELLEEIGAEELKNISLEMVATYLGITVLEVYVFKLIWTFPKRVFC